MDIAGTPALARLRWLLDGLDGGWADPGPVADALAPGFAARVPARLLFDVVRERAGRFAPITLVGLDAEPTAATARFRTRDGDLWVSHVEVEASAPHRVTLTHTQKWIPDGLAPRLPAAFEAAAGGPLVVFGGVPGSGKSTVADRVGAVLGVPVFALDWLLGAMTPFGGRHRHDLMGLGEELLTTLAYRELTAGRPAILDTTAENPAARARWASLGGAGFVPVVCVCSDADRHRERVERRVRDIAGWPDAGDWPNVVARLEAFPPWPGALHVDTARPLDDCVDAVVARVRAVPGGSGGRVI